ncbi:hypothetical protein ACES2J_08325 [Bdellovibrio bacteriovorus]|uniref:hypothetical protein n=1 Tax=Bdellovibrio bacteriovorus TaxID=959 RepID=UPI0035A6363E
MEDNNSSGAVDSAPVAEEVEGSVEEQGFDQEGQQVPKVSNKRKYKYKVDGQDIEEEIDLDNEEEIKRRLSLSKAAYKRMEAAAKTQKQAEQFVRMLQQDPVAVLSNPHIMGQEKFREIAEQFLAKQLEDQMMTPEEKYRRGMEEKLKKYEDQEREAKQRAEEEQMVKLQEHYQQDYEQKIIKGLQSQGLPKTAKTVRRMAELMAKSAEHDIDLSPEHLAEIVRQDYINEMKEMFGASEGDTLLNLLGDEVGNKIRKADLAKLRGTASGASQKFQPSEGTSPKRERIKASDYDSYLKKKLGIE